MLRIKGDVAIYSANDGRRYRVYDVREVEGKGKRVPLGAPEATHRIFQAAVGAKRAKKFHDADSRDVAVDVLRHQLSCAGWIGAHLYRPPEMGAHGAMRDAWHDPP